MKIVYRITYPNGKIYVGQDITDSINYFGSASSKFISRDFNRDQRKSFTVTRDILWESEGASQAEVNDVELRYIRELEANNPDKGYNRWPPFFRKGGKPIPPPR